MFRTDTLSLFTLLATGIFSLFTMVYSLKFMRGKPRLGEYYLYLVLAAVSSAGVVLADNLLLLLVCWGFLGFMLYLLINMGEDEGASAAAKKALIIVGGTDALMLLGLGIIYYFSGSARISQIHLGLNHAWLVFAYLCVACACFAKAGAVPFHSWVPDCAKSAPVPVSAYLPASLDKLLGIYLLFRLSFNLFTMNRALNSLLMFIGALTIISAVMMALVQHNLKKLLGFHAVSQVGYMVLGLGTGNPLGIAGGLFHMLNHAIYKSCLFFSAGNVEYRSNTTELDKLGGLSRLMPLTYISTLVASLSISGIPPFNGFVSKWLIYQGLFLRFSTEPTKLQGAFSVFCIIAAMFGSALTLASFVKLLHAVFLGQQLNLARGKEIREVHWTMWGPCFALAALCVIFGVFAFVLPLKYFIFPVVSNYMPLDTGSLIGTWAPLKAALLLGLALLIGYAYFKFSGLSARLRQDNTFSGGELVEAKAENMPNGTDFYNTLKELKFLSLFYRKTEDGSLDLYEQSKRVFSLSRAFSRLHNGVLSSYLVWVLLGMAVLFFATLR